MGRLTVFVIFTTIFFGASAEAPKKSFTPIELKAMGQIAFICGRLTGMWQILVIDGKDKEAVTVVETYNANQCGGLASMFGYKPINSDYKKPAPEKK